MIPPTRIPLIKKEDQNLALLLAYCSNEAYFAQPNSHTHDVNPPEGYDLLKKISFNTASDPPKSEVAVLVFKEKRHEDIPKIIFAFRGTFSSYDATVDGFANQVEWEEKALGSSIKVHFGFYGEYYLKIKKSLVGVLESIPADSKLLITGHSLGSAIATLFHFDLLTQGKTIPEKQFIYRHINYACPRVGNGGFAQKYRSLDNGNTLRIVNYYDVVPCLPPTSMKYVHAANYWMFGFTGINDSLKNLIKSKNFNQVEQKVIADVKNRHSLMNYYQLLYLMLDIWRDQQPNEDGTWKKSDGHLVHAHPGETAKAINYYKYQQNKEESSGLIMDIVNWIIKYIIKILKHL